VPGSSCTVVLASRNSPIAVVTNVLATSSSKDVPRKTLMVTFPSYAVP
jgi:hypothetical protein